MTIAAPVLLELWNIRAGYGHLEVLTGVEVEVPVGGAVALLGTNGAGKSTLLKVAAGLLRPTAGTVTFDGQDITGLRPEARKNLGLALVEGGKSAFPSLSVSESLRLAGHQWGLGQSGRRHDRVMLEQSVDEVLDLLPGLRPLMGRGAGTLSGGEQQMVALGRALIGRPKLLMVDELSLGLAPLVVQHLIAVVGELAARGVAVLLVEQSLNVAMAVTTHAYFMEKGAVRFAGPPAELLEREDLARAVFLRQREPA